MTVNIQPMPASARGKRFKPQFPPVFPDGPPTEAELRFALALFAELDDESKTWYGGERFAERLRDRLPK